MSTLCCRMQLREHARRLHQRHAGRPGTRGPFCTSARSQGTAHPATAVIERSLTSMPGWRAGTEVQHLACAARLSNTARWSKPRLSLLTSGGAAAATQRHARLQRPVRQALAGGCATAAAADRDRRGARPRAGAQGGALAPAWALGPLASGAAPTLVPIHAGVTAVRVTLRMPGRRREGGAVRAAGRIMRPIYKRGRGRLPRGRV